MTHLSILSKDIRILDGLYSLNDLHRASGARRNHQPANFIRLVRIPEQSSHRFRDCPDTHSVLNRTPFPG
jgi:hypothetical protein